MKEISMLIEAGVGLLLVAVGSGATYVWLRNSSSKKFAYMELEAKAKAKAIELETERMLQEVKVKIKEDELALEKAFQDRVQEVEKRNRHLITESREIKREHEKLQKLQYRTIEKSKTLEKLEKRKRAQIDEVIRKMERVASMTEEEAKAEILEKVELKCHSDIAAIVRKYEHRAKEEGEK
ncbi:MAG TPA: DUF3552 domain-containing protein, partial [Epsilonproteobacteria bacterium]|nr:DUF3552 domain-containing protein [Campylobacterota bacterium]